MTTWRDLETVQVHTYLKIYVQRRIDRLCIGLIVEGHKSALAFGLIGPGEGIPVVAMLGRVRSICMPCILAKLDLELASFIPMKAINCLLLYIRFVF